MMGTVGKLGRILGPQGKMPSPKAGTITFDISKAVSDVKSGKIEYRTDRTAIMHAAIGKKSFEERALVENYGAVLEEILRVKPAAAKGRYLSSVTMASTMGPGIQLDTTRTRDLLEETRQARPTTCSQRVRAEDRRGPRAQTETPDAGGASYDLLGSCASTTRWTPDEPKEVKCMNVTRSARRSRSWPR